MAATNRYRPAAQLRTALRQFLRKSEVVARSAGITPNQHNLLLQIAASEGGRTKVSALVDKLCVSQSTVTELVQRAEHAGLVRRDGSREDGRVVYLSLTKDGEAKLAQVHHELGRERARLRRMMDGLED